MGIESAFERTAMRAEWESSRANQVRGRPFNPIATRLSMIFYSGFSIRHCLEFFNVVCGFSGQVLARWKMDQFGLAKAINHRGTQSLRRVGPSSELRQVAAMDPTTTMGHVTSFEEDAFFGVALQHVSTRGYLLQSLRAALTANQKLTRSSD